MTDLKKEVQKKIYEQGTTTQVNDMEFFHNLFKRHPNYENKTKNMKSIGIEVCLTNTRNFRLYIINNDESHTEISYLTCINGKYGNNMSYFNGALRYIVENQISQYRLFNFPTLCELCNEEATDVDHIIKFDFIVKKFITDYNVVIPSEYKKLPNTYKRDFLEKDNKIKKDFQEFHKKTATLRPLCHKCNTCRTDYKETI
jgi:hypothetical protein